MQFNSKSESPHVIQESFIWSTSPPGGPPRRYRTPHRATAADHSVTRCLKPNVTDKSWGSLCSVRLRPVLLVVLQSQQCCPLNLGMRGNSLQAAGAYLVQIDTLLEVTGGKHTSSTCHLAHTSSTCHALIKPEQDTPTLCKQELT